MDQNKGLPTFCIISILIFVAVSYSMAQSNGSDEGTEVGLDLGLDGRQTFILGKSDNLSFKMSGIRLGIEIDNRYRSGLGLYGWQETRNNITIYRGTPREKQVSAFIKFRYLSLYYDMAILKKKQWEISTPIQFGQGSVFMSYQKSNGKTEVVLDEQPKVATVGVTGYYKFFTWFGIGGGAGYRFMISDNEMIRQNFTAPFYMVNIKVFVGPIFNAIFNQQEMEKTDGCLGCYYGCFSF